MEADNKTTTTNGAGNATTTDRELGVELVLSEVDKVVLVTEILRLEEEARQGAARHLAVQQDLLQMSQTLESAQEVARNSMQECWEVRQQLINTRIELAQVSLERDTLAKRLQESDHKSRVSHSEHSSPPLHSTMSVKALGEQLSIVKAELTHVQQDREILARELAATKDQLLGVELWRNERRGFRPFQHLVQSSRDKSKRTGSGSHAMPSAMSLQATSAAQSALAAHWVKDIIPNFEEKRHTKEVKALWCRGIPDAVRGRVWFLALGNTHHITEDLFMILAETSKHFVRDVNAAATSTLPAYGEQDTVNLIVTDIGRTFPSMGMFGHQQPLHASLIKMLCAFVMHRPDLGYVQGMSYLSAFLLLFMDDFSAFVCFVTLINSPCFHILYHMNQDLVLRLLEAFDLLLQESLPEIHAHLHNLNVQTEMFLLEWFMTLYSRVFPLETAARIWDLYMLYRDPILFRTAFGILKLLWPKLQVSSFDEVLLMLKNVSAHVDGADLMRAVASVEVNSKQVDRLLQECMRGCVPQSSQQTSESLTT